MKNKALHTSAPQMIKKGVIFLFLSLFVSSCTNSALVREDKIAESLSRGKAVVAFGFSQGDQVIDAAHLRFEISKGTGEKLKSKEVSGFFNPDITLIRPGNFYDNWSLVEKHRSGADAKIGNSDFYYPRYQFFEVDPGYYDFNIKAVYRARTVTENAGTFNVDKGKITYIGTFYFLDVLKRSKNSLEELPTQNFMVEENGVVKHKKRSMNFVLLDTYSHFTKLYDPSRKFSVKQIAVGDFYKDSKVQSEYPLK